MEALMPIWGLMVSCAMEGSPETIQKKRATYIENL